MNINNLSVKELKDLAAHYKVPNYRKLNKQELIKELVKFEAASNENLKLKVEDVVDNTVGKEESVDTTDFNSVLSSQAAKWKTYLKSIGSTAEMFLTRYPNHKYKVFIEEVLKNEKKEQ